MTNFDATLGGYAYTGSGKAEYFYTVVIIFHIFILNILLLNYMIAILSTTYAGMLELGAFMYKCSLYEYCERYMIAYIDKHYGELVLHAPPVNVATIILLPFVPFCPTLMPRLSRYFSLMNFWLENLIGVLFFIIFELILIPIVFLKTNFNIMYSTHGLFTTVFNLLKWLIFGMFYLFFILTNDVFMLLKILSMH